MISNKKNGELVCAAREESSAAQEEKNTIRFFTAHVL